MFLNDVLKKIYKLYKVPLKLNKTYSEFYTQLKLGSVKLNLWLKAMFFSQGNKNYKEPHGFSPNFIYMGCGDTFKMTDGRCLLLVTKTDLNRTPIVQSKSF